MTTPYARRHHITIHHTQAIAALHFFPSIHLATLIHSVPHGNEAQVLAFQGTGFIGVQLVELTVQFIQLELIDPSHFFEHVRYIFFSRHATTAIRVHAIEMFRAQVFSGR